MLIICDAYNILKQLHATVKVPPHLITEFVDSLKVYARKKKHEIMVVFDGHEPRGCDFSETGRSVTAIFTNKNESADDFIIRHVQTIKGQEVAVVSDDRMIKKRLPASVIELSVIEFIQAIQKNLLQKDQKVEILKQNLIKKLDTSIESTALDILMNYAADKTIQKKIEDSVQKNSSVDCRLPKNEKRRLQKLKKL